MQLAQYISTIANGGSRMEPHMVKEIREPQLDNELGPIVQEIEPKVLNRLDLEDGWIERIQLGMKKVNQESGGTAASSFRGKPFIHLQGRQEQQKPFMMDHLNNIEWLLLIL